MATKIIMVEAGVNLATPDTTTEQALELVHESFDLPEFIAELNCNNIDIQTHFFYLTGDK